MTANLKSAIVFGLGLVLGMAMGNSALTWAKSKLS